MNLVIDTSAILAVVANERKKQSIINASKGYSLVAPESVHWEIGNALTAMFKKRILNLPNALDALQIYQNIPIRFYKVDLADSIKIANMHDIYAYDAYILTCALKLHLPILTLDKQLIHYAQKTDVPIVELE